MTTQNSTKNAQLTEAQQKAIALKQHLEQPVFIVKHDAKCYIFEGDNIEEWKNFLDFIKGDNEMPITEYGFHTTFLTYCQTNLTEVEAYEEGSNDYLVLTDEEAEDRWDESMDSYIEECILPELPKHLQFYFDSEKWKKDASYDGRGHCLASYDGEEHEEEVNGTTYYIYRIN